MKTFLQFIRNGLSQISEEKEENFPDDVLSGFEFSKSEKLSNTKRDVYIVKYGDRENDAEEILMNMSLKDLLKNSQHNSDKNEREIRFADAGQFLENMDKEEWKQLKPHL